MQAQVLGVNSNTSKRGGLQRIGFAGSESYTSAVRDQGNQVYEAVYDPAMKNVVCLIGNLGKDVELSTLPSGKPVAKATLAVSMGSDQPTNWYDVKIWDSLAESAAAHLRKGNRIVVHGYLQQDFWNDRATGAKRSKTLVVANNIGVLPRTQPLEAGEGGASSMQPSHADQWPQEQHQPGARYAQEQQQQEYAPQQAYLQQHVPQQQVIAGMPTQPANDVEALWMDVVSNPQAWWDNRKTKRDRQPDFRRRSDNHALWLSSRNTPGWVPAAVEQQFGP